MKARKYECDLPARQSVKLTHPGERLKRSDNIVALSQELGVHRRLLYKWRDQLEPIEDGEGPPANSRERELRQQVTQLKRVVADRTLEADFFKSARLAVAAGLIGIRRIPEQT